LDAQERLTRYRAPVALGSSEYEALRLEAAAHCQRFGYPIPSPTELGSAELPP
jgi:hypothetical protein